MQGQAMSIVEAAANVAIGFLVALCSQLLAFPLLGVSATMTQYLTSSGIFTAVSLLRNYLLRRFFVRLERRRTG